MIDVIDCPICKRSAQPKQLMYRRCRECHKNRRNKQYADKWRIHASQVQTYKYRNDPVFRERADKHDADKALSRAERRPQGPRDTVYFIGCAGLNVVKIGFTTKPMESRPGHPSRLAELRVGSPLELRLIAAVPAPRVEEMRLHRRFAADRVRGEWFRLTPELLAHIASLTDQTATAA